MNEPTHKNHAPRSSRPPENHFHGDIHEKAQRKQHAARRPDRTVWYGLGAFGMVGWTVAIPTLLGALLGVWLDRVLGGPISWTLTLLVLGLAFGCLSAWRWVWREQHDIEHESEEHGGNGRG